MSLVDAAHESYAGTRRIRVLRDTLAPLLPRDARVLDVGCGDGRIGAAIAQKRPDLQVEGIEVLVRNDAAIPVREFDGLHIPFDPGTYDALLFVDVLHHCDDPAALLAEARRVAPSLVVKDHRLDGVLAGPTLRFMDRVGNERHGVRLPYNYWPERRWREAAEDLGFEIEHWQQEVPLYPPPASWIFGRGLHFVARFARR